MAEGTLLRQVLWCYPHSMSFPTSRSGHRLRRQRRIALSLLLLAFALFVIASLARGQGPWAWVLAASEAALVGGLADWFAVVALFRHPLGLPIPHTAILPRNRERLARRLAQFIREHFLQEEAILALLRQHPPAAVMAQWLQGRRNRILLVDQLQRFLHQALVLADLEPLRLALAQSLSRQLEQLDLAHWSAQLLQLLTQGGRHQTLLSDALGRADDWLAQESVQSELAEQLDRLLQRAYPTLFSWLRVVINPVHFSQNLASNLLRAAQEILSEIRDNPQHPKRIAFDAWLQERLEHLHNDPALQQQIRQWQREILAHPAAREYVGQIVSDLRQWLLSDLANPRSHSRRILLRATQGLAKILVQHAPLRAALDAYVEESLRKFFPSLQDRFSYHVEKTMLAWPMTDLIRVLEEGIGSDLQYIRINGTLVGTLLGILIHGAFLLLGVLR